MKIEMKRVIAVIISASIVIGALTGCKKNVRPGSGDNITVTTVTPLPNQSKDEVTPEITQEPEVTETPVSTKAPAAPENSQGTDGVDAENGKEADTESNSVDKGDSKVSSETGAEPVDRDYGPLIAEDSTKTDDWNYTVRDYNAFLNGEEKASSMNKLSTIFKVGEAYNIYEIGEGFRLELESTYIDQGRVLDSVYYSVIDCGNDGFPELAVSYTYEDVLGYDSPYTETMIFCSEFGWLYFVGSLTTYYRGYSTLNEAGYCSYGGSSGANEHGCDYYYIHDNYMQFMYSENDISNLTEAKIPWAYLPSDTKVTSGSTEFDDKGCTLTVVNLNEDLIGDDYDRYLRECYYVFSDFDGNPIMPDEDYIAECAADGLRIVSWDEMSAIIADKEELYGITAEIKNAPEVINWTPAPEGAWEIGTGIFANFNVIASNMDMWLDRDSDYEVCYAVTDMDYNCRFELIRAEMDLWTGETFLSFFEVNEDFTGLNHLEYEEQFTYEGEIEGWQLDLVNTDEIRKYTGPGGKYYYVIPTDYIYDTLAATLVQHQNAVLSKTDGENSIVYEGYTGGTDCYTTYKADNYSEIDTEVITYYRWDDTECTQEEYKTINKAYFDFDPDGYNVMDFCFIPMMEDAEDDYEVCFAQLLESFHGFGGGYVYSPDGK